MSDDDKCMHPFLSESHEEHGHGCLDCGGDFPNPEECYECALEVTTDELRIAHRDRHDLRKALSRACNLLLLAGGQHAAQVATWRHLVVRTDPNKPPTLPE